MNFGITASTHNIKDSIKVGLTAVSAVITFFKKVHQHKRSYSKYMKKIINTLKCAELTEIKKFKASKYDRRNRLGALISLKFFIISTMSGKNFIKY